MATSLPQSSDKKPFAQLNPFCKCIHMRTDNKGIMHGKKAALHYYSAKPEKEYMCPNCRQRREGYLRSYSRTFKHLPSGDLPSYAILTYYSWSCKDCGCTCSIPVEGFSQDDGSTRQKLSNDLIAAIQCRLQDLVAMRKLAKDFHVSPATINKLSKQMQAFYHQEQSKMQAKAIEVDEVVGTGKGSNFNSCVFDADKGNDRGKLLGCYKGRKAEGLKEILKSPQCAHVKCMSIDMNASYEKALKDLKKEDEENEVKVVFDLFHLLRHGIEMQKKVASAEIKHLSKTQQEITQKDQKALVSLIYKWAARDPEPQYACTSEEIAQWIQDHEELSSLPEQEAQKRAKKAVEKEKQKERAQTEESLQLTPITASLQRLIEEIRLIYFCNSAEAADFNFNHVIATLQSSKALAEEHQNSNAARNIQNFINLLLNHKEGIVSAYNNCGGTNLIEGKNRAIKVFKQVTYGRWSFEGMVRRILFYFNRDERIGVAGGYFVNKAGQLQALMPSESEEPLSKFLEEHPEILKSDKNREQRRIKYQEAKQRHAA